MIADVDAALRTLVHDEALTGAGVDVAFEAPTKDWAAKRTSPTISAYLYDIREDVRRRESGFVNEYDGARVRSRHSPPRYFRLSYLVAAWTQRPEDEHGLLSRLLQCLVNYQSVPTGILGPTLRDLGLPVPMTVALPPAEDRSFADVWSALGGELKPSLDVVISAPLPVTRTLSVGPPVLQPTTLDSRDRSWPNTRAGELRRRPRIEEDKDEVRS